MAKRLKELCTELGLPLTRHNMQFIGHGMRGLDPDVWVNLWRKANDEPGMFYIVDDARYQNEIDLADTCIYLEVSLAEQWVRYQTSNKYDASVPYVDWCEKTTHATETQPLKLPFGSLRIDTTIINQADVLMDIVKWVSPRFFPTRVFTSQPVEELPWDATTSKPL